MNKSVEIDFTKIKPCKHLFWTIDSSYCRKKNLEDVVDTGECGYWENNVWKWNNCYEPISDETWSKLKEIWKKLEEMDDKTYVFFATFKLLSVCDGAFYRDGWGFNRPDAFLVRYLLTEKELSDEQIEFLRRLLLKYEKQLKKLGVDYERLQKIKISEKARFLKKT